MAGFGTVRAAAYDAASRQQQRQMFLGMNAYDRHKKMVQDLIMYYGSQLPQGGQAGPDKTDHDILLENFRFIRSEEDDAGDSWEVRLARRYYSKLFREYAIADLSRYKKGKVGLRWRTQQEVVNGSGQFVCGTKGCGERRGLASFEVPFAYLEAGECKQALVKVRVCPTHAYQLNYRKQKEAERRHKARRRKEERRRRRKEEQRGGGSSGKDKKGRKKRQRYSSSSEATTTSSTSSSDSGSKGKNEEQRSSRKRRRHSEAVGEQRPAATAAAVPGQSAPDNFDAFLNGMFE